MTAKIIGKRVVLPELSVTEGERLVDSIVFEIPADYNGVDLSSMHAYANLKRSDGSTDKIILTKSGEGEGFSVRLDVSASVTAVAGDCEVIVSFESEEGTVVFMSEKFVLQINPSPNALQDYVDRTPNAIVTVLHSMYGYVERMEELCEEVDEKISQIQGGSGGGGGGGTTYDENNKLSAEFVEGLSTVATSGSYADLIDAPDLTAYALSAEVTRLTQPLFVKYISLNDEASVMVAGIKANKVAMAEYVADGIGARRLFLLVESTNSWYPVKKIVNGDTQLNIYFDADSGEYSISYNKNSGSFGFSE